MSKALQWVIGVGVVLVVAAMVFSSLAPYFLPRAGVIGRAPQFIAPERLPGPRLPFLPGFLPRFGRQGPRMPFLGLFGLAGCIWPLLLAGLIVFAILAFSRRPAAPSLAPIGPAVPVAVAPVASASQAVCAQCGQPLQPGWRHCPNCGQSVVESGP